MLIKLKDSSSFIPALGRPASAGETVEVSDTVGTSLIQQGKATKATKPSTSKTQSED